MEHDDHIFGKYTLLERIDVGGMAEVFRAKLTGAEGFERVVAIKRILPEVARDENFVRMFIDEAKIASRLSHPNIAQIFDLGREGDDLFIALEFVHGRDVRALWNAYRERKQRMPRSLACHVALHVAEALHHAHTAEGKGGAPLGLIHRDVSPQNILVSFEGQVKVIDFGLAKAAGRGVQTAQGIVKGKLAYMSPEQASGGRIDLRSDVYALGIVLWELFTGERLFFGKSDVETITRVQRGDVPSPRKHVPDLPDELERVVGLALQRDVEERYQTALELHDDLQAYVLSSDLLTTAAAVGAELRRVFPDDYAKFAQTGLITLPEAAVFDDVTTNELPLEARTVEERLEEDDATTGVRPKRR